MSNTNWKQKLVKAPKKNKMFSKKDKRFLTDEEEKEVLRLLTDNQKKIMDRLMSEPNIDPAQAKELTSELLPLDDEPCVDG